MVLPATPRPPVPTDPRLRDDVARTFKVLEMLHSDGSLGVHDGDYGMAVKYGRTKKGSGANPFGDAEGHRAYVAQEEAAHRATLIARGASQAR
jgi:hypothetical protein